MTTTAQLSAEAAGYPPGGAPAAFGKPDTRGTSTGTATSAIARSLLTPFLGCEEVTRPRRLAGSDPPRPRPAR